MSDKDIKDFVDELGLEAPVSPEEFKRVVKSAYMDRSRQIYFIWKKIQELYPEVDANRIIREGSWDFGLYQGNQIVKKSGVAAERIGPKEALFGQTSKGGMLVFEQEIIEAENDKAVKHFCACPHCESIRELGASDEEIRTFCRDMLSACDYAIVHPFPNVKLDFPTTVSDGKGEPCRMIITRAEK